MSWGCIRIGLCWVILAFAVFVPIAAAALSPLLAWRDPIYVVAGFAGVIAMVLLFFQPILAAGYLPKLSVARGRRVHRWVGSALALSVVIHVVGLWLTSPPDVIDALLFASPTPFSIWGVIAMWGVFATAALVLFRGTLRLRASAWRLTHRILSVIIVIASILHAVMIEGTMEMLSKSILCVLILVVTVMALADH